MSAVAYKVNGHVCVYFNHDHKGVNMYDCSSFNISSSGDLLLYSESRLIRAYAQGQWILANMVYPDDQGKK